MEGLAGDVSLDLVPHIRLGAAAHRADLLDLKPHSVNGLQIAADQITQALHDAADEMRLVMLQRRTVKNTLCVEVYIGSHRALKMGHDVLYDTGFRWHLYFH